MINVSTLMIHRKSDHLTTDWALTLLLLCMLLYGSCNLYAQGSHQVASQRLLTAQDLAGYSKSDLKIMRNEIFARYGYVFKTPDMKEHFSRQPWYNPTLADVSKLLTPIEKKNIELIKQVEANAPDRVAKALTSSSNGYAYSFTSERIVTTADVAGLSSMQLKIMRNEIFARHGYIFKTRDMKEHFGRQNWYSPTRSDVSSLLLPIERQNIDFIKAAEERLRPSDKLMLGNREVASVEPVSLNILGGSKEYILVSFADDRNSWSIYYAGWSGLSEQADMEVATDTNEATDEYLLSKCNVDPLLSGDGARPLLSSLGHEGDLTIARINDQIIALESSSAFWSDYVLRGVDTQIGDFVLLPRSNKPGRVGLHTVKKVVHRDGDEAIWFIDSVDNHVFASASSTFAFEPSASKPRKYINLGTGFAVLEKKQSTEQWRIYGSSVCKVLELSSGDEFTVLKCGGDNDYYEYCSYTAVTRGRDLRYLINLESGLIYRFPSGTRIIGSVSDYSGIEFSIPGVGAVRVDNSFAATMRDVDNASLDSYLID